MNIIKVILHIGDNLNVMQNDYWKKIKPNIIYIDPPYNTRNSGMSYDDNFSKDEWIEFMKPRIHKIFEISDQNAVFYFSIGNEQIAELKLLLDQLFGCKNFVALMPKLSNLTSKTTKLVSRTNDWLLIYKKGNLAFHGLNYHKDQYKLKDQYFNERGYFQLRRLDYKDFHYSKSLDFEIKLNNKSYYPGSYDLFKERKTNHFKKDWAWIWCKKRIQFAIQNDFIIEKGSYLYKKTYANIEIKKINNEYKIVKINRQKPIDTMHFMDKYFKNIAKNKYLKYFSYPKSTNFLNELIQLPKFKRKVVLDIFAGSGSIAYSKAKNLQEIHLIQKAETLNQKIEDRQIKTIDQLTIKTLNEWKIKADVNTYE